MRDIDIGTFSDLVHRVYAAGLDPGRWQDFLDALDREMDGAYLSLYGYDARSFGALPTLVTRYPEDRMAAFHEHYHATNPFPPLILRAPIRKASASEAILPREDLLRTEFYNDFLALQEDIGTGAGGLVYADQGRMLLLSGQVRFRDGDRKVPRLMALIDLLIPHIRQAFALRRRLDLSEMVAGGVGQILDRARSPAMVLDRQGRLLWHNDEAGQAVQRRLIEIAPDGIVSFPQADAQRCLERGLAALLADEPPAAAPPFAVRGAAGGDGSWSASLMLMAGPPGQDLAAWLSSAPAVLLTLTSLRPEPGPEWSVYAAEIGLTAAERDLAEALVAGLSLADHADRRGSSLHTVRAQAKSLYAKTGTARQAQLVARVAGYFY